MKIVIAGVCGFWVGLASVACGDGATKGGDAADTATEAVQPETTADSEVAATETTTADSEVGASETTAETDASEVESPTDSEIGEPDGETSEPPPTDPWAAGTAGVIEIVENYSGGAGEVMGGHILIQLDDGVAPTRLELIREVDACRLFTQSDRPCASCSDDEVCTASGVCQRAPAPVSAGAITFTGLVSAFTGTPAAPIPLYIVTPDPPNDGLFAASASIAVNVAGTPSFAGFEASVRGVGDLTIDSIGLVELVDGQPFELAWTPDGSDGVVEVVLQLGWHGAPPTARIVCAAPDAAGKITIPLPIIAGFPYFTFGLFQVPSWADRLSRKMIAGPFGPIEIKVASRVNLGVTHVVAPE